MAAYHFNGFIIFIDIIIIIFFSNGIIQGRKIIFS